jgi:dCTP diphosphatase
MDLNFEQLKSLLRQFNEERDWDQFHSPDNLAKSVAIEAGELLECFQWDPSYDKHDVADEIADIMMYCIMLADKTGIDLDAEILRKLEENKRKYPVDKCKGKSDKYDKLGE